MSMKVLFLDCDGVLNSEDWFVAASRATESDYLGLRSIDPTALKRLFWVLDETGAEVVLSSTWRLVPQYVDELKALGLVIHSSTPVLHSAHRATEILSWLDDYIDVVDFAIVDDDPDAGDHPFLKPRFIQTSWKRGLQDSDCLRLISLLGKRK